MHPRHIRSRSALLPALIVLFALVACRQEPPPPTPPPPSPVIATRTSPPFPTPTPEATPTPPPTPTATLPPPPALAVEAQTLAADGRLLVARAVAPEGGWLAVHAGGVDGPVLAAQRLPAGASERIGLTIDPYAATETLVAVLHRDAGVAGAFEWPGIDEPLLLNDEPVAYAFTVDVQVPQPSLLAADQFVAEDGLVRVGEIVAPQPAWLAVYADADGAPDRLLGFAPLPAGTSQDVAVRINWREGTPTLWLAMLRDAGALRVFSPDEPAVLAAGNPVVTRIRATYAPDLVLLDQPVVNGEVVAERVLSDGPGWLVVFLDADGQPGNIVGFSALADGLNERLPVAITGNVTPLLHVRLHADEGEIGVFEVPGADQPILGPDRRIPGFSFRTDQGPVLIAADQAVTDTVTAALLVADVDMWLVAWSDEEGEPGAVIGRVRLGAGMHWDVAVPVEAEATTPRLYLTLHADAGTANRFDFPDGPDEPLQAGGSPVILPLRVIGP